MAISDLRRVSYFDMQQGQRVTRNYKTEQALADRIRSLSKDEMECIFVPAIYESYEENLNKREECFMFLTNIGIYPLRLDMPDNEGAISSEYFDFEGLTDYDMVIFENFDFSNASYTEAYIYNSLLNKDVIYIY